MSRRRIVPGGMEDDSDEDLSSLRMTAQNLKITVVPHITFKAGLNGEDFDGRLPPALEEWFKTLTTMYNTYKKCPTTVQFVSSVYLNSENPLLLALQLFANASENRNIKNKNKNVAIFVLETVCDLATAYSHIKEVCTDNMRMVAFNFVKTCGLGSLCRQVVDVYDLKQIRELLLVKVREMINAKQYKDAAYWSIYLDLTQEFSIYDIVVPLILQDKIFVSDDYLDAAVHHRCDLIEFLDSLMDKKYSIAHHCDPLIAKYKYTDVRLSRLHSKSLRKLIARLSKRYNTPESLTPNMNFSQTMSYMNYLLHRKYIEGGMSVDAWRELIRDTVATPDLQVELVFKICSHGDVAEGVYWAKTFNLPFESLPNAVQDDLKNNSTTDSDTTDSPGAPEADESMHQLSLADDCVVLVDSNEKIASMLQELTKHFVVGFDSEWKPSRGEEVISIVQLATADKVYLIDVISNRISPELWKQVGSDVFNNSELLKIGFSLSNDLKMMQQSLSHMQLSTQTNSGYLDLMFLWKKLNALKGFKFPFRKDTPGESLSALAEVCIGKKLDKSNQFSNWANRPLRKDQIKYAALDAYCLIEIYNVINTELLRMGIDIDAISNEIVVEAKSKNGKSTRKTSQRASRSKAPLTLALTDDFVPTSHSPRSVSDVKFVCDEMLKGLVGELRKYGIDSVCATDVSRHPDACVHVALEENRVLLTRDRCFERYSKHLPADLCLEVSGWVPKDQMATSILKFYNINVTQADLLSRCVLCNSNIFLFADSAQLQMMKYGEVRFLPPNDLPSTAPQRNFVLYPLTDLNAELKTTTQNVRMQLREIGSNTFKWTNFFYICDGCGKCYWDGPHLEHFMADQVNNMKVYK